MNDLAERYWLRALTTLGVAKDIMDRDACSSVSRSYYAAFYAVSGFFALKGKSFKKHQAIEQAIHRDLIQTGHWPREMGKKFSYLLDLRGMADYIMSGELTPEMAAQAIADAEAIIRQVAKTEPDHFKLDV